MMKMLVVEDDPVSAKVLSRMLSGYGHCDVAVNGKEGVELFKTASREGAPYRVVFLDLKMPVMDGQEALREMRDFEAQSGVDIAQGAKVIITTAYSDSENVFAAHISGCSAYLVKPIQRERLENVLKALNLLEE